MPRIRNEEKLEAIKAFLKENRIGFVENYIHENGRVDIPLYIPDHRIGVRIGDDQSWYMKSRGRFYPVFIRTEDTKAKVLEKIQNTIIKSMTTHQVIHNKINEKNGRS